MNVKITLSIQDATPEILTQAISAALLLAPAADNVTTEEVTKPKPQKKPRAKKKEEAAGPVEAAVAETAAAPAPAAPGPTMDDMKHRFADFTSKYSQEGPAVLRNIMKKHGATTPKLSELDAETYPAVLADIDAWEADAT